MPLSLAQADSLIAAAHDHARANDWKIAVAVVDEGGLLVALGRMDGAFPLSSQIAEAKAAGAALWHRDGERLAASHEAYEGFFNAVSSLARLPLIPGPGSVPIEHDGRVLGAAGASGASGDDDRACVEAGLRAVLPGWAPA
jgi:glc operon protein GlcG